MWTNNLRAAERSNGAGEWSAWRTLPTEFIPARASGSDQIAQFPPKVPPFVVSGDWTETAGGMSS